MGVCVGGMGSYQGMCVCVYVLVSVCLGVCVGVAELVMQCNIKIYKM